MTLQAKSTFPKTVAALLVFSLAAACSGGGGGGGDDDDDGQSTPSVISNSPADGATDVALNGNIQATFSEAMDPATLTESSFVVTYGAAATPVDGTVIYTDSSVVFWPSAYLASNGDFTATITVDAKSLSGVALSADSVWEFSTGSNLAPGLPVNLGTARDYAILAKSGISTVPTSAITGDLAVSPAAASYITGFTLTADSTTVFATSAQVTGKVFAADYSSPTPSNLTTAVGDMQLAFTDAASRPPDEIELAAGSIGGMTLAPGVYKWGTSLMVSTDLALSGSATDVWIFQIAGDLIVANAVNVSLSGGALPKNIFWQVSGEVQLGTTSHFEGIVLSQTAITLATGASINGRLLAQTAVDVDASTVVEPAN
jgi:hypothetical protein